MRIIFLIFLALHGLIHILGFVVNWRLATVKEMSYKTTIFNAKFDIGDNGIKIVGLFWLLLAIAFIICAIMVFNLTGGWLVITLLISILSLILCLIGLPDSLFGVIVNVIIILYLLIGEKLGLLNWVE